MTDPKTMLVLLTTPVVEELILTGKRQMLGLPSLRREYAQVSAFTPKGDLHIGWVSVTDVVDAMEEAINND